MKMIYILVLIMIALSSCEQTVDVNLPYEEQLVVKAILTEGIATKNIYVGKTLPPLEYTGWSEQSKYWVNDAVVTLEVNGKIYQCTYRDSSYYQCFEYIPKVGDEIKFSAKRKDYEAYASTVIPDTVNVEKYDYKIVTDRWDEESLKIYAYFKPSSNNVYIGLWKFNIGDIIQNYYYPEIIKSKPVNNEGFVVLNFFDESENGYFWYNSDNWNGRIQNVVCVIDAYDEAYYEYFVNYDNYYDDDFFFGSSGQNINWNVKGRGFGVFVGRSRSINNIEVDIVE